MADEMPDEPFAAPVNQRNTGPVRFMRAVAVYLADRIERIAEYPPDMAEQRRRFADTGFVRPEENTTDGH